MKKLFSKMLWSILTGLFGVVFTAVIILTYVATSFASSAINMMFGTSDSKTINDPNAEAETFYSTDYDFTVKGETLYKEDSAMIEEAEAAGAVLLWNNSQALPMAGTEKISLLGHATVDIVECGTGSGYVNTYDYKKKEQANITMKQSFESRGFKVNDKLWNFYSSLYADGKYKMINWKKSDCTAWQQWTVNEVPQSEYTSEVKNSYATFGDAAIVMLARSGGEYSDLHYNYTSFNDYVGANDKGMRENTSADGGYLGLSNEEEALLQEVTALKRNKTFKKVILLLNTGNPMQMQDFEQYYTDIDACMWIGQPGSTGMNAVADLLKGKDMNGNELSPSGRLSDTWAYDNNSAPATVNDGNYIYGDSEKYNSSFGQKPEYHNRYMVYQENIYVGYRYYETRYFDGVTNQGNAKTSAGAKHSASGWSYNEEVAFPFGYGASYTEFTYGGFKAVQKDGNYEVSVTVTNSGDVAGKEVVQVYLSKPYTDYDIEMGVEKSAVELVGYGKTKLLKPGESQPIKVTVSAEDFKTYDAEGEQTYIIERGDYYLTVATDSHVATNNVLDFLNETPVEEAVLGGTANTRKVNLGKDFVAKFALDKDYKTYSYSSQTGYEVTNLLDSGDINRYANRGNNSVVYLSRSDWDKTYPKSHAVLTMNDKMAQDLLYDRNPAQDGYELPDYNIFESGSTTGEPDVMKGDVVAFQFMDAPLYPDKVTDEELLKLVYDDGLGYVDHWNKMWNQLLDQMTFEQQCDMVMDSFHRIRGAKSVYLPESKQENGPVGITKREEAIFSLPNDETIKGENGTGWTWLAYPCAGILAASFDNDIAQRVGEHKSEDMLYLGYNGIYGPGVNMHRSPFGGRAFEYPSEDPFLAGYIEAYETIGIESKGCMAYAKHFALNDMETNRANCGIWSTEQANREIYLRAFEIVFTVGKASATMNAYTRVGTEWNGACKAVMTDILREEWGYDGIVISDWMHDFSAMSFVDGVMAGTNTFDTNSGSYADVGPNKVKTFIQKYKDNAAVAQAVRESVKVVIYNVVRTNVMNGMSITSRVVSVTPWWKTALYSLDGVFGVIFVACAGMLTASLVIHYKNKKKSAAPVEEVSDGNVNEENE